MIGDKSNTPKMQLIKYSNVGILSVLIILSILSIVFSVIFQNSKYLDNYANSGYRNNNFFINEIYSSLYDSGENDYPGSEYVKYVIRSLKISNFENTKDFRTRYPNEVIVRDSDNNIVYRGSKTDFESQKDNYVGNESYKISIYNQKEEEPIEKINLLTNLNDLDLDINPQDYKVPKNKNIYAIKGFYENGNLKITYRQNIDWKYDDYVSQFNKSLKNIYKDIDYKYHGIEKLNFMYLIDFNNKQFQEALNEFQWQNIILPATAAGVGISFILTIFFAAISNFEKLKKVSLVEALKRFPIEIVTILCGLWAFPLLYLVERGEYLIGSSATFIYIFIFVVVLFFLTSLYYYVLSFKSIYCEGTQSFVWKNSVICRFISWIISSLKKLTNKTANYVGSNIDISTNAMKKCQLIYIAFIILGLLGSMIVVQYSLRLIVFILWMCLISIIYILCKKYFLDLSNLNKISKEIADGNYSVKINEEDTLFKGLAHSFNTISDNLNIAVNDAVKSERMKTELITNVSHDLKTPLTSIINYSDLIVNDNTTDEEKNAYAKVIYDKSIKLKHLIEDLFEVSKASSGNIELDLEDIDFRAIIMQIAGEWEDKFEEKNLTIVEQLPENQIILNLDGNKTSRILDNLFSNIYKYAMPNTRVYIDLFEKNNKIIFTIKNISNYSLNISPEELVDRFTRGDESRNTEGSGLGLSIASSLVEAQKGKFSIEIDGDLFKTEIQF